MKSSGWFIGTIVVAILGGLAYNSKPSESTFAHLCDAKSHFVQAGFHCISDSASGELGSGFLLSRENVSWLEAGTLCKVGQMGPKWKGKVWVTFNSERWQLRTMPENAGARVWGSVIAFGDEELLDEIDSALKKSPFPVL